MLSLSVQNQKRLHCRTFVIISTSQRNTPCGAVLQDLVLNTSVVNFLSSCAIRLLHACMPVSSSVDNVGCLLGCWFMVGEFYFTVALFNASLHFSVNNA